MRPADSADAPAERDAHGALYTLLPGMVDLHNHGGAGHSFPTSDAQGCRDAVHYHRQCGTTTQLASLVSAEAKTLVAQAAVLADLVDTGDIAGIHMEGPFLNAVRCGAQDPAVLGPGDPDLLERVIDSAEGHLRSITIAPEIERFDEVIKVCAAHNVVVSIGHSDATAEQTETALESAEEAGATLSATHLFNGMPSMHHRTPGIAGAVLRAASQGRLTTELIADGVHVHDAIVSSVLAAAPENTAFVSDAMAAAGIGDGHYILGNAAVQVRNGIARLATAEGQEGSIAGGTTSLLDQLRRHAGGALLSNGGADSAAEISQAARAVQACTRVPAAVIGLHDRGQLVQGMRADLVRLDSQGRTAGVILRGHDFQRGTQG